MSLPEPRLTEAGKADGMLCEHCKRNLIEVVVRDFGFLPTSVCRECIKAVLKEHELQRKEIADQAFADLREGWP